MHPVALPRTPSSDSRALGAAGDDRARAPRRSLPRLVKLTVGRQTNVAAYVARAPPISLSG